jgi:hypothetical protein
MIAAFRKNNLGRRRGGGGGGGNVVDLHNLQVIEALRLLTVLLANMKRNGACTSRARLPPASTARTSCAARAQAPAS